MRTLLPVHRAPQHISNGGQDPVNPGVNALGPAPGIGWHF